MALTLKETTDAPRTTRERSPYADALAALPEGQAYVAEVEGAPDSEPVAAEVKALRAAGADIDRTVKVRAVGGKKGSKAVTQLTVWTVKRVGRKAKAAE